MDKIDRKSVLFSLITPLLNFLIALYIHEIILIFNSQNININTEKQLKKKGNYSKINLTFFLKIITLRIIKHNSWSSIGVQELRLFG